MIEYDVFKDGKQYMLTMSFDDGAFDERLIGIFDKYGIKGTFHLNSGNLKKSDQLGTINKLYKNHEVACHGSFHRVMQYIPAQALIEEIFEDRKLLENAVKYPVRGLSYANGNYTDEAIYMLKSLGIVYSRTTKNTGNFVLPEDFMKWNPTCKYTDCLEMGQKFLDSMTGYFGYPKLLYIWGHGLELERYNHWDMMEEFCRLIGNNDKIWYATNIEIYNYITAQRSLVISADNTIIYNPTATRVWFSKDGTCYSIDGGETLYL